MIIRTLYPRVLGAHWSQLAPVLQRFHTNPNGSYRYIGTVTIAHSRHWLARLLLNLMRTPKPCRSAPCEIQISVSNDKEYWHRTMNGQAMQSFQRMHSANSNTLTETQFPYTIVLRNKVQGGSLWQRSVGGYVFGIPLARSLQMRVFAHEWALSASSFGFNVRLCLPILGTLLQYRGQFDASN